MKPIIGITCDLYRDGDVAIYGPQYKLRQNYCTMVAAAGGIPVIIPTVADVAELAPLLDGVLIPGGRDIDPARFGQEMHPQSDLQDPSRFESEDQLYKSLPEDTPVFGICYGSQFINVVHEGTLNQHIPDQLHHHEHEGGTLQAYQVEPQTQFASIVATDEVKGKSFHHQAIDQVGKGLKVVARHEDGTIEAIEGTGPRWMVAVQWHPERTPDDPASQRLFASFVEAARQYRASRKP